MSVVIWPRESIRQALDRAKSGIPTTLICASEEEATRLRKAVYRFRSSEDDLDDQEVSVSVDGSSVKLMLIERPRVEILTS